MVRRLAFLFLLALELNVGYVVGTAILGSPMEAPGPVPVVAVSGEQRLVDKYDALCWDSTEAPLAEIPTAAIVRVGDSTFYTTRPRLVDAAFSEVLASVGFGEAPKDRIVPVRLCITEE